MCVCVSLAVSQIHRQYLKNSPFLTTLPILCPLLSSVALHSPCYLDLGLHTHVFITGM